MGGTTTLATGNAVRCDDSLRQIGIDLDREFADLAVKVPMTQEHYRSWSDLTVRLFEVFEELGFDPKVTPKFMEDASRCVACGRCVLGCRFGAKWTADRLLDGLPSVRVQAESKVERVAVEGARAVGVVCRGRGGSRQVVEADLVVLAAGGLNTPVILNASGFAARPALFVDPVICVAAPWEGAHLDAQLPMPFVSQRDGYILSPYFDWLSFFFNRSWRAPSSDIMSVMVKYADDGTGHFDGKRLDKPMTARDERVIERSVEEASCVLEAMGVRRDDLFLGTLNAGHPGGCLPLTMREAEALHHDLLPENLYVADASLLPRSMGNPPMLTIMALATRVARACNERFGG
jgi:choline dehydrogenase-like flavoprotein